METSMSRSQCTIGVLARLADVSPDTIRHYERMGLVPPGERTPAGYRVWEQSHILYLRWLPAAKRAGFTLRELADIFRDYRSGVAPCAAVRDLLRRKILDLDTQIAELTLTRRQLASALTRWNRRLRRATPNEFVPLLDDLNAVATSRAKHRANIGAKWKHQ